MSHHARIFMSIHPDIIALVIIGCHCLMTHYPQTLRLIDLDYTTHHLRLSSPRERLCAAC